MKIFTRRRIISYFIAITFLSIGAFSFQYLKKQRQSTVSTLYAPKAIQKVIYDNFEAQTVSNTIAIDGRLQPFEQVGIFSKVNGILENSNKVVKEGAYFKSGDLLFRIDDREAKYALLAQKSSLMTSITQMMPDLKFDQPASFETWKKYLDDFDVEHPLNDLPDIQSDQEKYYVSARNIFNQFYSIKSAETRLSDYSIYAPFSGVLTTVNIYPGALVNPGANLATMINTSRYELTATVALSDLKYIKVGQKVNLSSTDLDQSWTGSVSRIGSQIDPSTQNIIVYISVSGANLKAGMYLKGTITGGQVEEIYTLPKDIFVNPSTVYVIQDSILREKYVTTFRRLENTVLVKGLEDTDMVITGSRAGLYEGQKVSY